MGRWPTQGDENQLLFSNYSPGSTALPLSSRPERTRISYFALLATTTCAALRREPHADHQSHGSTQEIRGSELDGPAVSLYAAPNPTWATPLLLSSRPTGGICSAPCGSLQSFMGKRPRFPLRLVIDKRAQRP